MKKFIFVILLFLSTSFKANAEQNKITLAELNQSHHGAVLQYVYASREKLRDYIVDRIYTQREHLESLKPMPEEERKYYQLINYNSIWWGWKSIIDEGARINYNKKDDEIVLHIPIIFYGLTNREFNIAIANTISIARFALGIDDYVGINLEPSEKYRLEEAFSLYKKIFPFSDPASCQETALKCADKASPELKHTVRTIMSKIRVSISVYLLADSSTMNAWSEFENFLNLDWRCKDLSERKYYIATIDHTISNGYSIFSREKKNNGLAPVYRVNDLRSWQAKKLNAYFKGAALCEEKGFDLKKQAINKVLDFGSWYSVRYLY